MVCLSRRSLCCSTTRRTGTGWLRPVGAAPCCACVAIFGREAGGLSALLSLESLVFSCVLQLKTLARSHLPHTYAHSRGSLVGRRLLLTSQLSFHSSLLSASSRSCAPYKAMDTQTGGCCFIFRGRMVLFRLKASRRALGLRSVGNRIFALKFDLHVNALRSSTVSECILTALLHIDACDDSAPG